MPWIIDLTGQRFGRLTVLPYGRQGKKWLCRCDCGSEKLVFGHSLRSGTTKSCGCYQRDWVKQKHTTHGASGTKLYHVWMQMKDRCLNPRNRQFPDYGGRGITVAPEWMDFAKFKEDMGEPPPKHSLDRKDNDGPYSKDNCRWATRKQQNRNTRRNRKVDGVTVAEIAEASGGIYSTVYCRLRREGKLAQPRQTEVQDGQG